MRIVLIGCGIVGRSFLQLLLSMKRELQQIYGMRPRVVAVIDTKGAAIDYNGLNLEQVINVKLNGKSVAEIQDIGRQKLDALQVLDETDCDVVIETIPTNLNDAEPALTYIRRAMRLGRHVITTNKGPLALHMPLLLELSRLNKVMFKFSGTVGGGTPILDFAKKCLKGDKIVSIRGILNGTTNYILCSMERGQDYESALKEAQRLGIAEADPSLDVDGYDAAAKLVILANWVLNTKASLKDVQIEGIRKLTINDFKKALAKGLTIRLIARAEGMLSVKPTEISKSDMLCVEGSLNAVQFISRYAGSETVIGKGAGGVETASAILRDLIDIKEMLSEEVI
jgi:homoserine dehydrogenase